MKVFINNKELSISLENEKNAFDIISQIEILCNENKLLLSRILINDEEFILSDTSNIEINKIETINIEALSFTEYALDSIFSIREYTQKIADITPETIIDNDINSILQGIDWILESVPQVLFLVNMALEDYSIMHILKTLEVKKEMLTSLKNDDNKDDIIKFLKDDFKPFLKDKMIITMDILISEAEINTILALTINTDKSNALYRISSLKIFSDVIIKLIRNVVNNLQTGNDKDAFILSEKFSKVVSSIFAVISQVLNIYDISLESIKKDGVSLEEKVLNFNNITNNIVDAFQNEDYVSIADILEYEIIDEIESIMDYIDIIEKEIENKNT